MEDLTLLTTTGARPEAWAICEMLMHRQTFRGSVRWIIVDDGKDAQPITFSKDDWTLEIVRPIPFWKPGENTQARNILEGLKRVKKESWLVVIEDDDWYHSDYLQTMHKYLSSFDIVGEAPAAYFNVSTGKGKILDNREHAGLCSTAMKGTAIDCLRRSAKSNFKFIDIYLWKWFKGSKKLFKSCLVIGIKGIPGRRGIGAGHRETFGDPMDLSNLICKDIEIYKKWIPSSNELKNVA